MSNIKIKAETLVDKYGKDLAKDIADELLYRDYQWIEELSQTIPIDWSITDYQKSVKLFDDLKAEIDEL